MLFTRRAVLASAIAFTAGCRVEIGDDPPGPGPGPSPTPVRFDFSFANGLDGWEPAYADYSLGMEASIGFAFGHERLPTPLASYSGLYLAADNRSDDLFMYAVRRIDGLAANRRYRVDTQLRLATNVPAGCPGAGGSPGESVYVKAGATGFRPEKVVEGSAVRLNIDKGNQSTGGADARVIGDLAQTGPGGNCLTAAYQLKVLSTGTTGPNVTTDSSGRLWLVIGADSGFEGFTKVYLIDGTTTLTPV